MTEISTTVTDCLSQEYTGDRRIGPTNPFIELKKEEIEQSIPERFEKIVRQYPDRLAVKMGARALTYAALNQAANRIARAILEKRGQGSEPIALLFEHGVEVIAAIFGTLKSGKFYVALDPSFPRERNAYILQDSGADLIVTNCRNLNLAHRLTKNTRPLLSIDKIDDFFSSDNLDLSLSSDLANVIYTSGSTGEPKGVVRAHRNFLHSLVVHTNEMRISTTDRLSLLHSVSFGSAEEHLYQSLLSGASLFPFDVKSEGVHRLASWLKEEQITVLHSPVAVFRQLADSLSGSDMLPDLRLIRLSGASITQLAFDLYKKNFPPGTFLEIGMGSTEARRICSAVLDQTFSLPKEGAPVGYTRSGKKILLLDENGHEVGPNQIGEIAVKSRYLPLGYWRRPDLTRAKFLADPSGGDERIYLTGDLGRMLPDGFLIHLGRKDFMVKIRGYRVELNEIERALLKHPQVKDAGVVAWDREPGDKYLVAYIVTRETRPPTINELHGFLKDKLPDYMIPSVFILMESLPLTNGKLDRKALPKPDNKRPELSQTYMPPRSDVERKLGQIWANILSLDRVGIHDNFFDLGGHSLAATRVVSQVIKQFQLVLPLQSLFQSPTVATMATVITASQAKKLGEKDLDRILAELELLSEEEARQLLSDQSKTASTED